MTPVNQILGWLSSAPFLHVAGIAAVTTLMGVGVVPVSEGLPILSGLIGLGINTVVGNAPAAPPAVVAPVAVAPVVAAPVAAPAPVVPVAAPVQPGVLG